MVWNACSLLSFWCMVLSDEQRKKIFKEGRQAAMLGRSRRVCPYLSDETPERTYIWMAGFDAYWT
ncbi:ribosome modulation factor [Rhizobium terrae]